MDGWTVCGFVTLLFGSNVKAFIKCSKRKASIAFSATAAQTTKGQPGTNNLRVPEEQRQEISNGLTGAEAKSTEGPRDYLSRIIAGYSGTPPLTPTRHFTVTHNKLFSERPRFYTNLEK